MILKGFNDQTQSHRQVCTEMQEFSYRLSMLAAAYSEGFLPLSLHIIIIIIIIE